MSKLEKIQNEELENVNGGCAENEGPYDAVCSNKNCGITRNGCMSYAYAQEYVARKQRCEHCGAPLIIVKKN